MTYLNNICLSFENVAVGYGYTELYDKNVWSYCVLYLGYWVHFIGTLMKAESLPNKSLEDI